MIEVDGLIYDYTGKRALHGLSFAVEPQTITALVGPNGAGKTTMMRCLAGLALPYAGTIRVDGTDVIEQPRVAHRKIGFLQDFFGLYDDMTVARCLDYHAAAQAVPRAERSVRVADTAERLGLDTLLERRAGHLSRGQRQRLAIGQAIIHRPKLLLLDEPASGLDPEARQHLSALLRDLAAQGITLIVSSHILSELEDYCTHMMVLQHGRLIAHGAVSALAQGDAVPARRIHVSLTEPYACLSTFLARQGHVSKVEIEGLQASFDLHGSLDDQRALLMALVEAGVPLAGLWAAPVTMQDVYNRSLGRVAAREGRPRA